MELPDEKMTVSFVDPLKIEVKDEINYYNPWYVEHASAFLKYCCPECEYKNGTLESFADHALQNHENAKVLFANEEHQNLQSNQITQEDSSKQSVLFGTELHEETFVKQEPMEYNESYEVLLTAHDVYSGIEKPKVKRSNTTTLAEKLEIIQLYENGTKISKIAKDKEMSRSSVRDICKMKDKYKSQSEQGASGNVTRFRAQPKKHLTLPEKLEIIQLYENGIKTLQIGKAKGMPESSVRLICKNKDKYKAQSEQVAMKEPKELKCFKCNTCGLKIQGRKQFDVHKQSCLQICELCDIEFADSKLFKSHISDKHKTGEKYNCAYCDLKFNGWTNMKYHTDTKHLESGKNNFFCTKCPKGFSYQSNLKFHMQRHAKWSKKHVCDICAAEYQTLNGFRLHMAKNHNTGDEPMLMCDKCDFLAPHKEVLQKHIRHKHDIDKHKKCPCCDFETVKTQKLYIHIDNHHPEYGDKKFVCDKCGNNFIYESSLKHHANSRCKLSDRMKSHVCTSCDSTFQTIQGLKRHTDSVHEKLKPFTCTVCDQSFSRKNHMSVHMATVHEKQKPFRCDICETKFTSKSALKEHVFVIHEKNKLEKSYKCSLCDSQFQKSNKLHDHIKVVHEGEKFPCTICNKEFRSRGSLKVHIAGIHEDKNPYQCDLCGKRFHMQSKVTKHILMVHEKKSPYLCNNCDEGFLSKSLLQAHIKSLHELDTILEPKIIMNFTTEKPEKMPELKFGTSEDPRSLKVDQLTNKDSSVEFENGQINPKSLEIDPLRNNDYSVEFENAQINPRKSRITKQETVDYDVDPSKVLELKFGTTEVPRSLEIDPLRNKDYSDEFENAQINPRKRRITKQETEDYNDYQSKVHKGKKLYRCPHCGDSFDSRYNKKIHLNTVHNGENGSNEDKGTSTKICEHCGSSFASNYRLKRHVIAVHEGERGKKQCNICGKRVNQLQGHIRAVHDKVKPFICSICGYKCGKQHQLDNHMELVHDEKIVRSIQCSQCDASFKDESSLIKHVKHAHENLSVGKQLGCPFCSGIFIGQRGIFGHVELEHPNWIDSFINKSSLLRHVLLQSSNSQNINGTLEDTQEILVTPVDLEKVVKTENVKSQEYTDRKSFKNKKGETVVVLSLEEKAKLIADSKKPGFCRKEVVAKYGINNNTITNILKSEDKIRKIIESGQKQVIPRVRLSLQVKARLIEESKQPGFNKKEVAARYGINFNTVINILSNQDKVLKLIESGLGHKTNTNFGKEMHSSNSDKMSYQYRSSSHHLSIQK